MLGIVQRFAAVPLMFFEMRTGAPVLWMFAIWPRAMRWRMNGQRLNFRQANIQVHWATPV
jgi:hypothetical protein